MKKLYLIYALIFVCIVELRSQIPQYISDSLQNVLEFYQGSNPIPGISAAVKIYNVGTWLGTTGESFQNTPLTSDMLMGIASNTKTFTAVLILKLVEQGIISLNDSLHKWLPSFNNVDSTITIKQLLRHNSGVADFWTTSFVTAIFNNPDSVWSQEDVLNYVGPPLFAPGTNVSYSNTNFTLAGMVIESATGKHYHTITRDSILNPLNLNNTFLEGFETVIGESAHPWNLGEDVYLVPRTAITTASFSAACMKSTTADMVNWYDELFNNNFLSSNSMAEMTDFINVSGGSTTGIGCGIFRTSWDSKTYYTHTGYIRGYSSYTMYDVEDKHIISVMRNDTFIDRENVGKALAIALNDLIITGNINNISQAPALFKLYRNFPNPFNPSTKITFQIPDLSFVTLKVYDVLGSEVATLVDEEKAAGLHEVVFEAKQLPSGVYFYSLISGGFVGTNNMLLVK